MTARPCTAWIEAEIAISAAAESETATISVKALKNLVECAFLAKRIGRPLGTITDISDTSAPSLLCDPMIQEWIKASVIKCGLSQQEIAYRLSEALNSPYDRASVNKMIAGSRRINSHEIATLLYIFISEDKKSSASACDHF